MSTAQDKAGKRKKDNAPTPVVPASAIRMAKVGGTIALIAAAAISAQTLVSLGHTIGLRGQIAWLLPASLDVYAATAIWVGYRIPSVHPAAAVARRDARLALSLTVCCNVLYHLLILAGSSLPKQLTDPLLLCVGALPPLVVERIFHLQMSVRNGDGNETEAVAAPATPAAATPTARPATTPAPVSTSATTTTTAQPATPRPATKPVSDRPVSNNTGNGNAGTVATFVSRDEQLRIVRELVSEHGPDVPLAKITERVGGHKSTASRLRSTVNEENGTAPLDAGEAEKEVI